MPAGSKNNNNLAFNLFFYMVLDEEAFGQLWCATCGREMI
jgi:hypothetical protein